MVTRSALAAAAAAVLLAPALHAQIDCVAADSPGKGLHSVTER